MKTTLPLVLFLSLLLPSAVFSKPSTTTRSDASTADHGKFEELKKDFKTAEEVTKACLKCHNKAAEQFQKTIHWTWESDFEGRKLGKRHVINNF